MFNQYQLSYEIPAQADLIKIDEDLKSFPYLLAEAPRSRLKSAKELMHLVGAQIHQYELTENKLVLWVRPYGPLAHLLVFRDSVEKVKFVLDIRWRKAKNGTVTGIETIVVNS